MLGKHPLLHVDVSAFAEQGQGQADRGGSQLPACFSNPAPCLAARVQGNTIPGYGSSAKRSHRARIAHFLKLAGVQIAAIRNSRRPGAASVFPQSNRHIRLLAAVLTNSR